MCEIIEPASNSIDKSVLQTRTIFTAKDKLSTAQYRMIGVDLDRGGYIRLQNLDTNTETIVEPEWFRYRKITIQQDATDRYPEYILRYLRQRKGLEEDDTHLDDKFQSMSPDHVFSEVLEWEGLLGGWDRQIKGWIHDIYGVDIDEMCKQEK